LERMARLRDRPRSSPIAQLERLRYTGFMVESLPIVILREPADPATLVRYARAWFGDMAKIVVDLDRGVLALGGELHADAEEVLIDDGSRQPDIWGANVYPFRDRESRLEYTSLINIRPAQGNRTTEVQDAEMRDRIRAIVDRLLPPGDSA
jgi:hypothetical protein